MGINSMRKLLSIAIMLLSSLSLGASLVSSSGGGVISAENSSLNLSSGRAYINLGFLTFGDIGRTGLLDAFDNPHSSFSGLSPRAIKPGSNKEGRDGFVLSFEDFSFIYSTDERALSGIFIDGGIIEAALLAASGNGEAKGFHEDPGMSTAYDTVYGGLDLSWGYLNVIGLISYADEIGFRGVLNTLRKRKRLRLIFIRRGIVAACKHDQQKSR